MRAQRRLRALAPLLAAILAVGLAACGSSSGSGQAPKAQSSLDSLSTDQLAAQAATEGSVTWYTTFSNDDVQPMVAAFNKVYPNVKVNALRLSADQIPPRIITEQRGHQYSADVVSGDSPQIAQLLQAGVLQPYAPKDLSPLPSGLSMPAGYQGIVYLVTTVIAYNPTVVAQKHLPVPTSWQDLTQPAWKGQFSIDPTAVNWYDSLVKSMGHDQALNLLKGLGANKPVFVDSHTQAITDVEAGEPPAAATAYGYKSASELKKNPKNITFFNSNPLPASLTLIDVVKNAPHPAAARLFDDWMVSQNGQQAVADITNHTSIRTDVNNDATVWSEQQWPPAWGDPNLPSATYNQELAEMKSALQAPPWHGGRRHADAWPQRPNRTGQAPATDDDGMHGWRYWRTNRSPRPSSSCNRGRGGRGVTSSSPVTSPSRSPRWPWPTSRWCRSAPCSMPARRATSSASRPARGRCTTTSGCSLRTAPARSSRTRSSTRPRPRSCPRSSDSVSPG
jgi:iron(III) transport system substrate-binding protein